MELVLFLKNYINFNNSRTYLLLLNGLYQICQRWEYEKILKKKNVNGAVLSEMDHVKFVEDYL